MRFLSSAVCALSLVAAAGVASANPFDVALVSSLTTPGWNDNIIASIKADAPFLNITALPNTSSPALGVLEGYQTVMVVGGDSFYNSTALGDTLAQYIQDGHGLVIAYGNLNSGCSATRICGAFDTVYDDWALKPAATVSGASSLGATTASPLLAGVNNFTDGTTYRRVAKLLGSNVSVVASWDDGTPLIATRTFSSGATEVALNFFPVTGSAVPTGWTGDGGQIMANAIMMAGNITAPSGGDGGSDTPEAPTYFITATGFCLIGLLRYRLA